MYKYVHPGTIKQGYLTKSPPLEKRGLKKWKKRWCIFSRANGEEPCLNYYHTEEDAFSSLPIKRVNLKHCFKVELDLVHSNHKNIFAIHMPGRVYYFSAPSQIEMSEWAETLCAHLNLVSSSVGVDTKPYHTLPVVKPRSSTLPPGNLYGTGAATLPPDTYGSPIDTYYNSSKASYLPPETYYNSSRANHLPAESYYSSSPNTTHRLLPKPPDSPLPPTPDERPPSPLHSAPISPRPHSSSPWLSSRSPLVSNSPTHPPIRSHSPHHLSPTHLTSIPPVPSHSSPLPTPPPVPSHSSPILPSHHASMTPPPILHPRSHSPSDGSTRPPNSPQSSRGSISLRPPAPPPKVATTDETGSTGSCESFGDLEEAPPTPPPRPRDKDTFSPPSESSSSSDSEHEPPPPLPPRMA